MSKARNMARMGQDTSAGYTGAFDMPAGTTAQRPASAGLGWTRLNTDTGSVEVYDGTQWNAVTRPFISGVTGNIYAGLTSNLVISGQNFTSTITVRFLEGGSTVADVSGVTVTSGSATVAVPAAVFGQTAGDTIDIRVINSDGTLSANQIAKTVLALPTGGSITVASGYRYHTFNSSDNFVVPSGFTASADYLVVAAGGGGGRYGGGGGAGGYRSITGYSISSGTTAVTIGAGGAGWAGDAQSGGNAGSGGNSSFGSITVSTGGGGAGNYGNPNGSGGLSGGSGGGAGTSNGGGTLSGGSATAGQGNSGGTTFGNPGANHGGGGGGAGASGANGNTTGQGGNGSTWLNGTTYAGGGSGSQISANLSGGSGGGGTGLTQGAAWTSAIDGVANTGGGGGGGRDNQPPYRAGNGGSGIVIIRYQI